MCFERVKILGLSSLVKVRNLKLWKMLIRLRIFFKCKKKSWIAHKSCQHRHLQCQFRNHVRLVKLTLGSQPNPLTFSTTNQSSWAELKRKTTRWSLSYLLSKHLLMSIRIRMTISPSVFKREIPTSSSRNRRYRDLRTGMTNSLINTSKSKETLKATRNQVLPRVENRYNSKI